MEYEGKSTKEKIIIAAIECTEQKGFHLVTVRDIALQAKVNIAAINYHFGSKEQLLKEMLRYTLNITVNENVEEIVSKYEKPELIIKALLIDILQGMLRFPNLCRAHAYGPVMNDDYSGIFVEWINGFAGILTEQIIKFEPSSDIEKVKFSVIQMLSAVFNIGLMPDLFGKFLQYDIKDSPEKQEAYIDQLINKYLSN
jgi:AcrR family transcriptional regulator